MHYIQYLKIVLNRWLSLVNDCIIKTEINAKM